MQRALQTPVVGTEKRLESGQGPALPSMKVSEGLPSVIRSEAATRRGIILPSKSTESVESADVGHAGGEQDLQLGLASSSIARLLRSEVMKVIDLSFDDSTTSELLSNRRSQLFCSRPLKTRLVNAEHDGATALARCAFAPDRACAYSW